MPCERLRERLRVGDGTSGMGNAAQQDDDSRAERKSLQPLFDFTECFHLILEQSDAMRPSIVGAKIVN